jgi:hypothetical protein
MHNLDAEAPTEQLFGALRVRECALRWLVGRSKLAKPSQAPCTLMLPPKIHSEFGRSILHLREISTLCPTRVGSRLRALVCQIACRDRTEIFSLQQSKNCAMPNRQRRWTQRPCDSAHSHSGERAGLRFRASFARACRGRTRRVDHRRGTAAQRYGHRGIGRTCVAGRCGGTVC